MRFTKEFIEHERERIRTFRVLTHAEKVAQAALDEIERLQAENDRLKSDAEQNELILLALHEALKEKQARVQELELRVEWLDSDRKQLSLKVFSANKRVQELEREQRWIPVNKKPKNHGWHFVLYNNKINWDRGYVGVNFYYLDKEEWSNNEDVEFYCEFQPPIFQSPQEEE